MAIDELEKKLRPPEAAMKPYPPKVITLADGAQMVVREARREEAGVLLGTVYPLLGVPKDFYDGEIAGIVTSRHVDENLGMSYHTVTIKRGLRIGAQLFAAKMEHHIDILGEKEVYIVAESPIGFKRWMIEYELENREALYPKVHHELGGVPTYVLTRKLYDAVKSQKVTGSRPVSPELLAGAAKLRMPEKYPQIPGFKREH
ncbi:MAG: hypothetical protein A2064_04305 [Spirochaetes bacterium GWB1_66_5]|nr:MAG: hypothetical protein A2064_04305 [Spirochaetes bacterium GWB1_66_5]